MMKLQDSKNFAFKICKLKKKLKYIQ